MPLPRPVLIAALALAGLAVVGCNRTVAPEAPKDRYESRGPKVDYPAELRGTIYEVVDVGGTLPLSAAGYGLVVNLENTGRDDGIPSAVREHILDNAIARGFQNDLIDNPLASVSPNAVLADPRTAIVRVDGVVPPGAQAGQRIDVAVTALENNTTPSLARGFLWQTELHRGTINVRNTGERVNQIGTARGPLVVNPIYALLAPEDVRDAPAARESLRSAIIPDGGVVQSGRRFVLRLRTPDRRTARAIEQRINQHFGQAVAAAQDEGVVYLTPPPEGDYTLRGPQDWQRFVGVAAHLFFSNNSGFSVQKAQELAEYGRDNARTDEELLAISYAWEGMGQAVSGTLIELFNDPNPAVAFAAARAAAHLRVPGGADALLAYAKDDLNPYNVRATRELGRLQPEGTKIARSVRELLNEDIAPNIQVRIEAYQALLRLGDNSIREQAVGGKFALHTVPGTGTPVVYATLSGRPTIALIGGVRDFNDMPQISTEGDASPVLVSAFGDSLTVTRQPDSDRVVIFQRLANNPDPKADASEHDFVNVETLPDLREVVGRLGGEGLPGQRRIRLGYGEVVALLKQLGDAGYIRAGGQPVAVRLEDATLQSIDSAPLVPGFERPEQRASAE